MKKKKAESGTQENPLLQNLVTASEFAKIKNVLRATIYIHINSPDKELEAVYIGKHASVKMIDLDRFKDYKFSEPKFKINK